jgi:hypothetical protein
MTKPSRKICTYKNYTSDALHTALVYIRNKHLSVANASKLFAIPARTLYQRLHKETSKVVSITTPSSSITTPSSYWTCTTSGTLAFGESKPAEGRCTGLRTQSGAGHTSQSDGGTKSLIRRRSSDLILIPEVILKEEVENDIEEVENDIEEVENDIEEVENDIEEVEKENCDGDNDTTEMYRRKLLFHLALSSSQLKHLH